MNSKATRHHLIDPFVFLAKALIHESVQTRSIVASLWLSLSRAATPTGSRSPRLPS